MVGWLASATTNLRGGITDLTQIPSNESIDLRSEELSFTFRQSQN